MALTIITVNVALLALFYLPVILHAQSICPTNYGCECGVNLLGKPGMVVVCDSGGLTSIPVHQIPLEARHLFIRAPPSKPNRFSLQPGQFSNFQQLEELHVTGSTGDGTKDYESLVEYQFYTNPTVPSQLRVLNLTNNALSFVNEKAFLGLSELQQLYLDDNRITSFTSSTFSPRKLQLLSLRNNHITQLPETLVGSSHLQSIDLSNNPIGSSSSLIERGTFLATTFNTTRDLRALKLRNTKLERIPFEQLAEHNPKLEQLDIGGSPLCMIMDGQVNRLRNLRDLDLSGMASQCQQVPFQISPGAFKNMPELRRINLGSNNLNSLGDVVKGIPRLESLGLSNNDLQQLGPNDFDPNIGDSLRALDISRNDGSLLRSRMFSFLPRLGELDLSQMNLNDQKLPSDLFAYPNEIRMLNLSRNKINYLDPALLASLPNLEVLDLSFNELDQIPAGVGAGTLKEIYLNDNRLREFPSDQLKKISNASPIRRLTLHNNPWVCDCGVFDLYQWLLTRAGRDIVCAGSYNMPGRDCPVCEAPAQRNNRFLHTLDGADFSTCRPPRAGPLGPQVTSSGNNTLLFIILAVVGAIMMLLLLLGLLAYWHRNRMHTYKTHEEDRKDYEASLYRDSDGAGVYDAPVGNNNSVNKPMLAQNQPLSSSSPADANPSSSLSSSSVASQNNNTPKTTSTTSAVNTPLFINNRYHPNGRPPAVESDM